MNLSASTLRYRLITGKLQLEPLRILTSRAAEWREWRVTFCILGASHAVRLERGDTSLTELLACAMPEGVANILIDITGSEPQKACRIAEGILCQVELFPFPLSEGDCLEGDFAAPDRLELAYPALNNVPTPYTRLGWCITERELTIETVHTYPEENLGIRSRSRFLWEEAAE